MENQRHSSVRDITLEYFNGKSQRLNPTRYTSQTIRESASILQKTAPADFRPPTPYSAYRYRASFPYTELVAGQTIQVNPGSVKGSVVGNTGFDALLGPNILPRSVSAANGTLIYNASSLAYAEVRALKQLKDVKLELGQALWEARQSVGMIAARAGQMANILLAMRKGNWQQVHNLLGLKGAHKASSKRFADNYLEYSFGWTPLVNDAWSAYQVMQEGLKRPATFSVRGSYIEHIPMDRTMPDLPPSSRIYSDSLIERQTRVKLYAQPASEFLIGLAGLGLSDPIGLAWALVPFSFVVDWVLPIGDFLDATMAPIGYNFLGGTRSVKLTGNIVLRAQNTFGYVPINPTTTAVGDQRAVVDVQHYDRKVYTTWPRPVPLYVKNPLSVGKAITATALIRQLK